MFWPVYTSRSKAMSGTTSGVIEGIRDITECCICTELFTDPRMLPCIHTFCLICLEKTGLPSQKKPGDQMPCPLCRKEFLIPTDGFLGLQKNFFMVRLIEMAKLAQPPDVVRYCDACNTSENETSSEVKLAKMYCIECEENVCDDCIGYHKRQKQLKTHQIVAFGNPTMNERLIKRAVSNNCDRHTKHSIEMYCHDCRKAICMKCFAIDHKGHNCSDVEDVAEEFRKQIGVDIEKAKTSFTDGLKLRNQIDIEKTNFIKQVESAEKEITMRANELKNLVDRNMHSLLAQLLTKKAETLKTLQTERDEVEMHLKIIDSFKTYCSEIQDKGTPGDICRVADDLYSQSSGLEQKHRCFADKPMSSFSVTFEKTNLEGLLMEINIIGSFEDSDEICIIEKHPAFPPYSLKMLMDIHLPGIPSEFVVAHLSFGLQRLENKVYVMYKAPFRVYVYDIIKPFSVLEEFSVKNLKSPVYMQACATSNCLYVTDQEIRCIWKIVPSNRQVTRWLSDLGDPFTLSVSKDGRVIIPRKGQPSTVEIYSSDASPIQSVRMPEEIQHPLSIVETPTENYIILHRCSDFSSVLSEVTKTGEVVHRFKCSDEGDTLNDSCCLEGLKMDDAFGVIAFDYDNTRAIFFDPELKWGNIISSYSDIEYRHCRVVSI